MGVHGLWRLIEPSGKPVPIETLENKILAVDVSIWLHQAIKGFQDSKGASVPNAHLLGLYHRVCKLLYFRILPVFIFDGGVPAMKKETIAKRNNLRNKNLTETYSLQKQLLNTLLKHSAVNKVISEKDMANMEKCIQKSPEKTAKCPNGDDIYKLPTSQPASLEESSSDDDNHEVIHMQQLDWHTIDEKSSHFKSLPANVRHEILTELKETRKQSSWGKIHELPTQSDNFSIYQMKRLLKRHSVQVTLEETEKEMGGHVLSLGELEALLNEQGVITSNDRIGSRIASNETARYLLIKDIKKAMKEAANNESESKSMKTCHEETVLLIDSESQVIKSEFQTDLKRAIQLSLQNVPSTSIVNYDDHVVKLVGTSVRSENSDDISLSTKALSSSQSSSTLINQDIIDDLETQNTVGIENMQTPSTSSSDFIEKIQRNTIDNGLCQKTYPNNNKKNINVLNSEFISNVIKTDSELDSSVSLIEVKTNGTSKGPTTNVRNCFNDKIHDATENNSQVNLNFQKCDINTDKTQKHLDTEFITDSESDSTDNFIEVEQKTVSAPFFVKKKLENFLEIMIKSKGNLEDDIFADIFSTEQEEDTLDLTLLEQSRAFPVANVNTITSNGQEIRKLLNEKQIVNEILAPAENDPERNEQEINLPEKLKHNKNIVSINAEPPLSTEQLKEIELNLIKEKQVLVAEQSSKERISNSITDQMYHDAQELLKLFGVPYIVAPMEAEAQCAFLDEINLTDGTITDDSDIWLFGGKTVYKNFFNQSKHVLEFRSENIHHSFKLSRLEMILLALLVGSDYTTGIQGVGPVTALEILATFPIKKTTEVALNQYHVVSGLQEFQKWFKEGKVVGAVRVALKNKLKNIVLSDSFPSIQVVQAYLEPKVETSREKFSWGKPDVLALVEFAREKFGWTETKSEEILKPVLKRMEESGTQKKITNYFKIKHKINSCDIECKMSKRVKSAINKMGEQETNLSTDEDVKVLKQTKKQSRRKVEQIESQIIAEMEKEKSKSVQEKMSVKVKTFVNLHKKDKIPQKEQDKANLLRSKLKAIEAFRKSKQGPGYRKKRETFTRVPKDDAQLSESSSD